MVVEVVAGFVVSQAVRLLFAPLAESARDQFVADVGGRVGAGAARIVTDWVARLADGPPEELEAVRREFLDQPEAGSALRSELERRLQVTLEGSNPHEADSLVGTDEFIVDAYEATFWRIATLAALERRSIAIPGALQGADWLTVCVPSIDIRFASEPVVVEPGSVWNRFRHTDLKRVSWDATRKADFFVKRAAKSQGPNERKKLNAEFRRSPTANFSPDRDAPLNDRWHELYGIHANWVELYPTGEAIVQVAQSTSYTDIADAPLKYDFYPVEWHPLLDIPDEAAGLAALNRGADTFTSESEALRQRVKAIVSPPDSKPGSR